MFSPKLAETYSDVFPKIEENLQRCFPIFWKALKGQISNVAPWFLTNK